MRAVGYCRVSSQDQIDGTSLKAQEEQILAYATLKGLELAAVLVDAAISTNGRPLLDRPEGSKISRMVERGEVQAVVVVKLDRAFRDVVDCLNNVDAWEPRGVALHIIDLGGNSIDTTSPAGRFMLTVLAAAAEMERGMINSRCQAGREARRAEGKRIGQVPFGFTLGDDNKLIRSRREQYAIAHIRQAHSAGQSFAEIARYLNERQVPTKNGRTWARATVRNIALASS